MRPLLPAILVAFMAPACASAPAPVAWTTTVEVTATYRERIRLPPGHVLIVRIEDVSLADAPAAVLVEMRVTLDGRAPPYPVTFSIPAGAIDPRHDYAARAEIHDATGALRFTTDTRHPVLTRGAGVRADIVMVGVG